MLTKEVDVDKNEDESSQLKKGFFSTDRDKGAKVSQIDLLGKFIN